MFDNVEVVYVGDEKVSLDRSKLHFTESTLNEYIQTEGGWIDYFGAKLAQAEMELAMAEYQHELAYYRKFSEYKSRGGTDKHVEGLAKTDPEVEEFKKGAIAKKHTVRMLQQHLRAWDKNHENAQSRGHFLRKEMDKLNKDIRRIPDDYLEDKLEAIVKPIDLDTGF